MSIEMKEPTKENIVNEKNPVLTPQLWKRNPERGGATAHAVGTMGSGKTTSLIKILLRIFEAKNMNNENLVHRITTGDGVDPAQYQKTLDRIREEKIFWRGQISCQWARIPNVEKILWVQEPLDLEFEVDKGTLTEQERHFDDIEELENRADPYAINIVYTKNALQFINLIRDLVYEKSYTEWASVFCDEWEDIAPLNMPSPYREHVGRLKNALKEARKRRVSFYGATQQRTGIDWQCLNKIMYWMFLKGSKPPADSRIWQRAIDGLSIGEAYFTDRSLFERVTFENYPPERMMNVKTGMPNAWALGEMTTEEG